MGRVGAAWWVLTATCGCTVTNHVPSNRASGIGAPDSGAPVDAGPISGGGGFDVGLDVCASGASLSIYPRDAILLIDWALVPPSSSLTYSVSREDCGGFSDVSGAVLMTVGDSTLGRFAGSRFTAFELPSRFAVQTTVAATTKDASDATGLTVVQYRSEGDRPDLVLRWPPCDPAPKSVVVAVSVPAGTALDVGAGVTDDPASAVSAASLVANVRAMSEGSTADGCAPSASKDTDGDGVDDTFTSIEGAEVCFEVIPVKTGTPASLVAWGELAATGSPGSIAIDTRRLIFSYDPLCTGPK